MFRLSTVTISAFLFIAILATSAMGADTLFYSGRIPKRHNRFYVDPDPGNPATEKAFIGDDLSLNPLALDFSGVGKRDATKDWLTMISESFFLTAGHKHPAVGTTVTFYEGNIMDDAYKHEYQVKGYYSLALGYSSGDDPMYHGDLCVGCLCEVGDTSTLADVTADNIAVYPIPAIAGADSVGETIYVYGHCTNVDPNGGALGYEGYDVIGRNEITAGGDVCIIFENEAGGGLGVDEATTQVGDSGAPSFTLWNNQLALAGIHYSFGLDAYVPSAISRLRSILQDEGQDVTCLIEGDLNGDGLVGSDDLDIVRANWGNTVSIPGDFLQGDPSGDGIVGFDDLNWVRTHWGDTIPDVFVPGDPIPIERADCDSSGNIGAGDLDIIRTNWGDTCTSGDLSYGDCNSDGFIGSDDLDAVRMYWGQSVPEQVPEPSTFVLIIAMLCICIIFKRR